MLNTEQETTTTAQELPFFRKSPGRVNPTPRQLGYRKPDLCVVSAGKQCHSGQERVVQHAYRRVPAVVSKSHAVSQQQAVRPQLHNAKAHMSSLGTCFTCTVSVFDVLALFMQVCTLTARELRSAAAAQLGAWMQQQQDLEVPPAGLEVVQVG